jgi:iron complex transport system substrate-binding protein
MMIRRKQTRPPSTAWAPFALCLMTAASSAAAGRLVTDQTGRSVRVPERPMRLVSLAPSVTETLFILGLGSLVVGDTDYCEYPPEAKLKPRVGSNLNPSLEKIVALKPDLVFGSPQANRRETADQLERLGIPVYGVKADTVEETLASIRDLGKVMGHESEATRLVNDLDHRIQAVTKRVKQRKPPRVLFVVWYRPLTTAGEKTFISDVIRHAGGEPISKGLAGEWPKMSLEEALRLDPDVILFPRSESFAPELAEFQLLPGWRNLRAVKARRMYMISDAIIRSSPRLVDSLEEVARILHPEREPDPEGKR